jgi:hypothetical protein
MMMPAGKYSFVIEAGATFNLDFTMYSGGSKWDLTGYSARMDIRVDIDSPTALISLDTDGNGITLGGSTGLVEIEIDATTTEDFPAGRYVYDFELEDDNGTVWRVIQGCVQVRAEVTHS